MPTQNNQIILLFNIIKKFNYHKIKNFTDNADLRKQDLKLYVMLCYTYVNDFYWDLKLEV